MGKLCRSCRPGYCADAESVEIECPDCRGQGCDGCNEGMLQIRGCPNRFCSSVVPAVELIDMFGKGLPPVSGGTLDQSVSFLEAARFLTNEEQRIRNDD